MGGSRVLPVDCGPDVVEPESNVPRRLLVEYALHEVLDIEAGADRTKIGGPPLLDGADRHTAAIYRQAQRQPDILLAAGLDSKRHAGCRQLSRIAGGMQRDQQRLRVGGIRIRTEIAAEGKLE